MRTDLLKALAVAMMIASIIDRVLNPTSNLVHIIRLVFAAGCTLSLWIIAEKLFFQLDRIESFRPYIENYKRRREFHQRQKELFKE